MWWESQKGRFCLGSSERVHITLRQKQRVEQKHYGYHGHIRDRALPPWPLGAARRAVRRGQRCRRSCIQGDRRASAQRRRTQEGSATRPEAWERKPTAEAVLRRVRRRAPPAACFGVNMSLKKPRKLHNLRLRPSQPALGTGS